MNINSLQTYYKNKKIYEEKEFTKKVENIINKYLKKTRKKK